MNKRVFTDIKTELDKIEVYCKDISGKIIELESEASYGKLKRVYVNKLCRDTIKPYQETLLGQPEVVETMNYMILTNYQENVGNLVKIGMDYINGNIDKVSDKHVLVKMKRLNKTALDYIAYLKDLLVRIKHVAYLIVDDIEKEKSKVSNIIAMKDMISNTLSGGYPTMSNKTFHYLAKVTGVDFFLINKVIYEKDRHIAMTYVHGSHPYTTVKARNEMINYVLNVDTGGITLYERIKALA